MFASVSDASKVALAVLLENLKEWGYLFIDCQVPTTHLKSLGAIEVSREVFLERLVLSQNTSLSDTAWQ
jgi:leucyl/phenylalanyl-tRNA--protein transferase